MGSPASPAAARHLGARARPCQQRQPRARLRLDRPRPGPLGRVHRHRHRRARDSSSRSRGGRRRGAARRTPPRLPLHAQGWHHLEGAAAVQAPAGLRLECRNAVPHGRGLGSSATAIVAGIVAAQASRLSATATWRAVDLGFVNDIASMVEGHPDNASASVYGGLTLSWCPTTARPWRPAVTTSVALHPMSPGGRPRPGETLSPPPRRARSCPRMVRLATRHTTRPALRCSCTRCATTRAPARRPPRTGSTRRRAARVPATRWSSSTGCGPRVTRRSSRGGPVRARAHDRRRSHRGGVRRRGVAGPCGGGSGRGRHGPPSHPATFGGRRRARAWWCTLGIAPTAAFPHPAAVHPPARAAPFAALVSVRLCGSTSARLDWLAQAPRRLSRQIAYEGEGSFVTETTTSRPGGSGPRGAAMRLAELQGLASSMGITGTAKMRKGDLVEAIKARQSGAAHGQSGRLPRPSGRGPGRRSCAEESAPRARRVDGHRRPRGAHRHDRGRGTSARRVPRSGARAVEPTIRTPRPERPASDARARASAGGQPAAEPAVDRVERTQRGDRSSGTTASRVIASSARTAQGDRHRRPGSRATASERDDRAGRRRGDVSRTATTGTQQRDDRQQRRHRVATPAVATTRSAPTRRRSADSTRARKGRPQGRFDDDDDGRGRRRSRNRSRNRDASAAPVATDGTGYETEPQVHRGRRPRARGRHPRRPRQLRLRAHVRLPARPQRRLRPARHGQEERPAQGRRRHRRGQGAAGGRAAAAGSVGRQKFNALVRLDTVNGMTPEEARKRVEFGKLTPLYPQERLRLETERNGPDDPRHRPRRPDRQGPARPHRRPGQGRQDDGHAGDRQRDHDEQPRVPPHGRPRRRAARGGHRHAARREGRGHRLDLRPPAEDHTTVAELAIERAKRLVEMGHDVVVLLDSITKLGRAYNLAARRAAASSPVVSTRPRSTRRRSSSAPRATSRTAAR